MNVSIKLNTITLQKIAPGIMYIIIVASRVRLEKKLEEEQFRNPCNHI